MAQPMPARAMRWMKGMMLRHMPGMITCREFEDFIMAYLEGELPERQRILFDLHLKICRECRDYLAAYRRSIDLSKSVLADPDAPVPVDVPEDLVQAVLSARDG